MPLCGGTWWENASSDDVRESLKKSESQFNLCGNLDGIRWEDKDEAQKGMLMNASTLAHPEVLKTLLEHIGSKNINGSQHGWTPLSQAVQYQKEEHVLEVMSLLLEYGADPNYAPFGVVVDSRLPPGPGQTIWGFALGFAAQNREISTTLNIVKMLLENGADPKAPSPKNKSLSLGVIVQRSKLPILEEVLSRVGNFKWTDVCGLKDDPRTKNTLCIHYAMENHDLLVVEKAFSDLKERENMLPKDVAKTSTGQTLLHIASLFGTPNTIKFLVRSGLDIHVEDNSGYSPLERLHFRINRAGGGILAEDEELMELMPTKVSIWVRLSNFFDSFRKKPSTQD